jgi:hypothetical protein
VPGVAGFWVSLLITLSLYENDLKRFLGTDVNWT